MYHVPSIIVPIATMVNLVVKVISAVINCERIATRKRTILGLKKAKSGTVVVVASGKRGRGKRLLKLLVVRVVHSARRVLVAE